MWVKAISLHEPYASLMRSGHKTIETRSWPTKYSGPLLICASKHWDSGLEYILGQPLYQRALLSMPEHAGKKLVSKCDLYFGRAVCLVDLIGCDKTQNVPPCFKDEAEFGDYFPGRSALVTDNLRIIDDPFPVKGNRRLFDVELPREIRWVPKRPYSIPTKPLSEAPCS